MIRRAHSILSWAARRPGYMLLTAGDEVLHAQPPARFTYAWIEVMLLSLGWGLAAGGLWTAAWRVFGYYNDLPLMPVAVVAGGMLLWLYRRATMAVGRILGGADPQAKSLMTWLAATLLVLAMLGLKGWYHWHRPQPILRALLLAPLWGGWAMMILPQLCRVNGRTEPAVAAWAQGCGPLAAAGCMGAVAGATILSFTFLPWSQLSIPAATVLGTILSGIALSRASGGLTRTGLLAANFIAQILFLAAYLANR